MSSCAEYLDCSTVLYRGLAVQGACRQSASRGLHRGQERTGCGAKAHPCREAARARTPWHPHLAGSGSRTRGTRTCGWRCPRPHLQAAGPGAPPAGRGGGHLDNAGWPIEARSVDAPVKCAQQRSWGAHCRDAPSIERAQHSWGAHYSCPAVPSSMQGCAAPSYFSQDLKQCSCVCACVFVCACVSPTHRVGVCARARVYSC